MCIDTRDSLIRHLQWALELEHSTIPPYLCALFSIHDGANPIAVSVIRSVVMEEMLHMTLVANLLNAVGGEPQVSHPAFVPKYPTHLPHSGMAVRVQLLPFSPDAIDSFLRIERPAKPHAAPEPERYHTIGQFYEAIRDGIERLAHRLGEQRLFIGKPDRQIAGSRYYYGAGGEPIAVADLVSARAAIAEVVEQGEGLDHTIFDGDDRFGQPDELAHYFRFNELHAGRHYRPGDSLRSGPTGAEIPVDWSARYPMAPNPTSDQYRNQREIFQLMQQFNLRYTKLLDALHHGFNGSQDQLLTAVPLMYDLKYRAQELMAIPSRRGDGTTVGPSFEYARDEPRARTVGGS